MDKIEVNSKNKETKEALVSEEDYHELNKYKWGFDSDGYARATINKKDIKMHKYIKINLMQENLSDKYVIDHINRDRLDNRRENLRFVSKKENSRNVTKKDNCSSKYTGVTFNKEYNNWHAYIRVEDEDIDRFRAQYSKEIHAAHQYNLWIDELKLVCYNKNDIDIPLDFIPYVSVKNSDTKKGGPSPSGIELRNGCRYYTNPTINGKRYRLGTYDTLDEAIAAIEKKKEELKNEIIVKDNYILEYDEKEEKYYFIVELNKTPHKIFIDKEIFEIIKEYKWNFKGKILSSTVNKNQINLSKFIYNTYIDNTNKSPIKFQNGIRTDYRKENLVTKIKK